LARKILCGFLVEDSHLIGTSHHTRPAPNTPILIYPYDAIFTLLGSPCWTYVYTERLPAMVAESRKNLLKTVAGLGNQNPVPNNLGRKEVFRLACHNTGIAAHTAG